MQMAVRQPRLLAVVTITAVMAAATPVQAGNVEAFDHTYRLYGDLLRGHVMGARVDYAKLQQHPVALDAVIDELGNITAAQFQNWSAGQQIAYLINAYNVFTLKAIVDHYPIRGWWFSWLSLTPRNSIKQIDGVWTRLRWPVAGAERTLDEIEHEILRKQYREPRMHFAINCASVSCPRLRHEPYTSDHLERQLILAARDYLASDFGLIVDGSTLRVSSILSWFNDDFVDQYARLIDADRPSRDRTILGVIAKYGPPEASRLAQTGTARIRFLKYDWSLNDTATN
jgi:hypothetical protein